MIHNILFKVSGNLTNNNEALNHIKSLSKNNYVVVICGGGAQVNEALLNAGYSISFDEHGRIAETWDERKLIREVLEDQVTLLQDNLVGTGAVVIPSILYAGDVLCHVNADNLVKSYHKGFTNCYVLTLKDRVEDKEAVFADYSNVEIIGIKTRR
jgi:acetylglutamate kinase